MKFFLTILILTICLLTFGQQQANNDSIYIIQDSVLIPTKSGIDISAIIVRKKTNTNPLPVLLFYTTYYQVQAMQYLEKNLRTGIMLE